MWTEEGSSNNEKDEVAAEFIIKRAVDINAKDNDGFTPLHLAIRKFKKYSKSYPHYKRVLLLLKYGFNINPDIKFPGYGISGHTPLIEIACDIMNVRDKEEDDINYEIMIALLERGANPNETMTTGGYYSGYGEPTPLHMIIKSKGTSKGYQSRYQ